MPEELKRQELYLAELTPHARIIAYLPTGSPALGASLDVTLTEIPAPAASARAAWREGTRPRSSSSSSGARGT